MTTAPAMLSFCLHCGRWTRHTFTGKVHPNFGRIIICGKCGDEKGYTKAACRPAAGTPWESLPNDRCGIPVAFPSGQPEESKP